MNQINRDYFPEIAKLPIKVLQFGTGNFLRGFPDWVIDQLNEKTSFSGAIHIVQPNGKKPASSFIEQDGMFHVLIKGFQNDEIVEETRLISSVVGISNPFLDYEGFLNLAKLPDLRFVISNTTEAGIVFDEADKNWKDLPGSFPGKLTALLFKRFEHFDADSAKGLVLIPCELIEDNGTKLKDTVLRYAAFWDLSVKFQEWVENNNIFCNTLVDRIVPGFPTENAEKIQMEIGYLDKLMVVAEPFHFWAIEGPESIQSEFPVHELGLGIKFVNDLRPYRTRKVRILNGAHTSMVPVAYLRGFRTVKEAIENKEIGEFVQKTINNEIIPVLDLPKEELLQFATDVIDRFKNPFIKHQLISIALNSISKFKVRVLPTILDFELKFNQLPHNLVHSFAALLVFYKGSFKNEIIPLSDTPENLRFFEKVWESMNISQVVDETLGNEKLWGEDLRKIPNLAHLLEMEIQYLLREENK